MSLLSKSDLASPGTSVNIYSIYGSQEAVLVEEAPTRAFPASAGVVPVVLAQGAGILIPFLIKDLVSPLLVFSVCQTTLSSPTPQPQPQRAWRLTEQQDQVPASFIFMSRRRGGSAVRFCAQDSECCLAPTLYTIIDSNPLIGSSSQSQGQPLSSQETQS